MQGAATGDDSYTCIVDRWLVCVNLLAAPDYGSITKAIKQSDLLAAATRYRAAHEPTPAQIAAGNYPKRKIVWQGMELAIENDTASAELLQRVQALAARA